MRTDWLRIEDFPPIEPGEPAVVWQPGPPVNIDGVFVFTLHGEEGANLGLSINGTVIGTKSPPPIQPPGQAASRSYMVRLRAGDVVMFRDATTVSVSQKLDGP